MIAVMSASSQDKEREREREREKESVCLKRNKSVQ